jgi:hypothetical protein
MALIGNYSVLNKSCAQFTNGTATAGAYAAVTPSNYQKLGMFPNRFGGPTGFADHAATPVGYIPPYSFRLPKKSGGLATFKSLSASISTTDALLALGINVDANLSANITETRAVLALIVALEASLSASGTITDANMAIIILLDAALSAGGSITTAELQNIVSMIAALSATGTLTNSITNLVNLSADISNASGGQATPDQIAAAVWNAILADYNAAGSTGAALGDAGGAGNPWSALLADNNDAGTFGARVQKLLTTAKFLGLK